MKYKMFAIILSLFILGCAGGTKTYKIVRVVKGDTIELAGKKQVRLIGIKILPEREAATVEYIKKIIGHRKAILLNDEYYDNSQAKIPAFYLYLWGDPVVDESNLENEETSGFLGVRDGLFAGKGLAPCLNAYLVRSGYARVDVSSNFEHKDNFLKLQQRTDSKKNRSRVDSINEMLDNAMEK